MPLPSTPIRRIPARRTSHINLLWLAQDGRCFHCGEKMIRGVPGDRNNPLRWTREHLMPRSRFGTVPSALVLAHKSCNNNRGNRIPSREEMHRCWAIYAWIARQEYADAAD